MKKDGKLGVTSLILLIFSLNNQFGISASHPHKFGFIKARNTGFQRNDSSMLDTVGVQLKTKQNKTKQNTSATRWRHLPSRSVVKERSFHTSGNK